MGMRITAAQSEALLKQDLAKFETGVEKLVTHPITQDQFDALVSFSFNLGLGALKGSTLLKKLNAGDFQGASNEFSKWVNAGGQRLQGLVRRRAAEQMLFRGVH